MENRLAPIFPVKMTQAQITELICLIKSHTVDRNVLRDILPELEHTRANLRGDAVHVHGQLPKSYFS